MGDVMIKILVIFSVLLGTISIAMADADSDAVAAIVIAQAQHRASQKNILVPTPEPLKGKPNVVPSPNPPVAPRIWRKNDHNPVSNIVWREVHPRDGLTWWEDKTLGVVWRYLRPNEDPVTLKVPGQTESGVSQLAQPFRGQSNCPT